MRGFQGVSYCFFRRNPFNKCHCQAQALPTLCSLVWKGRVTEGQENFDPSQVLLTPKASWNPTPLTSPGILHNGTS